MIPSFTDSSTSYHAAAFGCRWVSDLPLPAFETVLPTKNAPDIWVRLRRELPATRPGLIHHHRMLYGRDGFRFASEDFVADTYSRDEIEVFAEQGWTGQLPHDFYGTVTAALLTWRGGIAMHASAVEMNGKAVLLCGDSGAGKSTLAASLIAAGGNLISDDLSIIYPQSSGQRPILFPGRRALRLFPDVAEMLGRKVQLEAINLRHKGKSVVVPPRVGVWTSAPLAGVILLGQPSPPCSGGEALRLLRLHLYRRAGFRYIPGLPLRLLQLKSLWAKLPILAYPNVEAHDIAAFRRCASQVLDLLAASDCT